MHGLTAEDGRVLYNGMTFNNMVGLGGGRSKQFFVNTMDVQEIQLEMGGMTAENDTGGVHMNVVPRSGGNTFAGGGNFEFSNGDLQSNNLSDALRARGLTTVTALKKVYDYGAGIGGPIKADKLWFYTSHLSDDAREGWFKRRYIWDASVSVQHEVVPNTSVDVGYFRTWSGNFTVTDNVLVTPADYDPFCITLPTDPRLPGGGGNQLCDLGDIKPAKFGLFDGVVKRDKEFGKQERVYDGVDAKLTSRVRGALITGGWSVGRTRLNCVVVDAPVQFCDNRPPFQSDFKAGLSYQFPYEIGVAAVVQNIAGAPKCFNVGLSGCLIYYVALNSQIAPSLGRSLSAGPAGFQLTTLAEPNTLFEDRATQIDLRFSKRIPVGRMRILAKADLYNVLNRSAVARQNFTYGAAYGIPTEVMGGRLFKFGAQVDF